jgi:hypothetical protein
MLKRFVDIDEKSLPVPRGNSTLSGSVLYDLRLRHAEDHMIQYLSLIQCKIHAPILKNDTEGQRSCSIYKQRSPAAMSLFRGFPRNVVS